MSGPTHGHLHLKTESGCIKKIHVSLACSLNSLCCSYFSALTKIQTSVAHIGTHLLPERAEQTRSETVVGSIRHQVGQTLTDRKRWRQDKLNLAQIFTIQTPGERRKHSSNNLGEKTLRRQRRHHKTMCMSPYLYDLCERLRGGLSQQSQTESAVQLSDGGGQHEGERCVRSARRRRVFSHSQELTGAIQHGRQHLKSTRTHLEEREEREMLQPCVLYT